MAHILIIDDEPQIVMMLKEFLEQEGYSVTAASNGREGLGHLAKIKFDLVITDIVMPEMDGIEVLASFLKDENRPKIIAMSGGSPLLDGDHLLHMAKMMKVDLVLTKPLKLTLLGEQIRELLDR